MFPFIVLLYNIRERMKPMRNGWGYDPEGLAVNILGVTKILLELSEHTREVAGINITGIGNPSVYNPEKYYQLLSNVVMTLNRFNLIRVVQIHFWTSRDKYEWVAKYGARFEL